MPNELTNDEYQKMIARHEELKQQKAQADGAYAEIMRNLQKEFGCNTLKEAKLLLKRLTKRARIKGRKSKRLYMESQQPPDGIDDGRFHAFRND